MVFSASHWWLLPDVFVYSPAVFVQYRSAHQSQSVTYKSHSVCGEYHTLTAIRSALQAADAVSSAVHCHHRAINIERNPPIVM